MTTFDKREEGFESQFAHDEEVRFKAEARRNGLVARWVAEKLGLTGAAADDYARDLIDFGRHGGRQRCRPPQSGSGSGRQRRCRLGTGHQEQDGRTAQGRDRAGSGGTIATRKPTGLI